MSDDKWQFTPYREGTPAWFAQKIGRQMYENGVNLNMGANATGVVTWPDLVQAFADASDAAVDQHIRDQREKAEYMNAHEGHTSNPQEAQETPHRNSAQSIRVIFNDGTERVIHTHHPIVQQGGWKMRNINGVPFFIIGHGVPRQMIPLCNVKSIDLSEELL